MKKREIGIEKRYGSSPRRPGRLVYIGAECVPTEIIRDLVPLKGEVQLPKRFQQEIDEWIELNISDIRSISKLFDLPIIICVGEKEKELSLRDIQNDFDNKIGIPEDEEIDFNLFLRNKILKELNTLL